MRRGFLALFCLWAAGCSHGPSPEAAYAESWKAFRQGRLEDARRTAQAGLRRLDGGGSAPIAIELRLLEAESLLAQSRVRDAQAVLDQARALLDQAKETPDAALRIRWLVDQADALNKRDDADAAVAMLDEADEAAAHQKPDDAVFKGRLLRGSILARTHRLKAAEELLRKTADQAGQAGDGFNQAAALANLSTCEIWEDRFDEAADYGLAALDLATKAGAGRPAAIANDNLGVAYGALGDMDRSEDHQNRAIQQLRAMGDQRSLAASLGALGYLDLRRHEPDRAAAAFQEAARISAGIEDFDNAGKWTGRVAYAQAQKRDWDAAESWNQKAGAFYQRLRVPPDSSFLKLTAAAVFAGRGQMEDADRAYRGLIAAAQGGDPFVELSARLDYAELLAGRQRYPEANGEFEKGLETIERTASSLSRDDYRFTYYDLQTEFFREYVDVLVTEKRPMEALKVADYARARVLTEKLGARLRSIDQIQPDAFRNYAKRSGAVLMSYWLGPRRSFVWVVTPAGIDMQVLPGEGQIDDLVREYQRILVDDQRDPAGSGLPEGARLRQVLLGPVEKDLAGAKRVVVVPDGSLHTLNLETLPALNGSHYWIEDAGIAIAPSLSSLSSSPAPGHAKPAVLVMGAPESVNPAYPALPEARSEIAGIKQVFPGAEIKTGPSATPEAFLDSEPARFTLIHFAAHAEANPSSPLDSAVVLSKNQGDGGYKLYARDVASQKLSAEVVILSACRSAGARTYGGEGLVGFAWAFLEAGAHSVIAGLWDVSDSTSARMMDQVYAALASDSTPAEALRRAKLALLRSGGASRKPFYWAPFQIYIR